MPGGRALHLSGIDVRQRRDFSGFGQALVLIAVAVFYRRCTLGH